VTAAEWVALGGGREAGRLPLRQSELMLVPLPAIVSCRDFVDNSRRVTDSTAWRIGLCANCLSPLDPAEVRGLGAAFCSKHCSKQAGGVRYLRAIIRDGRSADPITALVAINNIVTFLALDLAYTRPRINPRLRAEVLASNNGLCVVCCANPATEVDHMHGGSEDLSNLRGLCRTCHELKPRGPIPDDLTRDGAGSVDDANGNGGLAMAWRMVLLSGSPLWTDDLAWDELRDLAEEYASTRFGWLTCEILGDTPMSPAHDHLIWRDQWRAFASDYRVWATQ